MNRWPTESSAAERARRLAELAEALEQAESLLWSISDARNADPEVLKLYGSVDSARAEVQALRSRRVSVAGPDLQPLWIESGAKLESRKEC